MRQDSKSSEQSALNGTIFEAAKTGSLVSVQEFLGEPKTGTLASIKRFFGLDTTANARDGNLGTILYFGEDFKAANASVEDAQSIYRGKNIYRSIYMPIGEQNTALHYAAANGHTTVVKALLNAGANVNAKNVVPTSSESTYKSASNTALHYAAAAGHLEVVKDLLAAGARINATNDYSITALHFAATNVHPEVVKILLQYGARVNAKEYRDCTPLWVVASANDPADPDKHAEVARILLKAGATVDRLLYANNGSILELAAENGHLQIVDTLLKNPKNVAVTDFNYRPEVINTILRFWARNSIRNCNYERAIAGAAANGHLDIVNLLLSKVNAHNISLDKALEYAAKNGHAEIVTVIFKAKERHEAIHLDEALQAAVCGKHSKITKYLLAAGANVNASCYYNYYHMYEIESRRYQSFSYGTLLMLAASEGQFELVRTLLSESVAVDARCRYQNTALMLAARFGYRKIVRALVRAGADVSAQNEYGYSALMFAARCGHTKVIEVLLKADEKKTDAQNKYGHTALILAAKYGKADIVRALVKAGANTNIKDKYGHTALDYAAKNGYTQIVGILTEQVPNKDNPIKYITARKIDYNTVLITATQCGRTQLVGWLLDRRANAQVVDVDGNTALHWIARYVPPNEENQSTPTEAERNKPITIAEALLNDGANVNATNKDGLTALHFAAGHWHTDMVSTLLSNGAQVDAQDLEGNTALHRASRYGHTGVAGTLLNHEADVNLINNAGRTALHFAAEHYRTDMVSMLLSKCASVNDQDLEGNTALCLAAKNGHTKLVIVLLNAGADINAKDVSGRTALCLAAENGHIKVVRMLLQSGADVNAKALLVAIRSAQFKVMGILLLTKLARQFKSQVNNSVPDAQPPQEEVAAVDTKYKPGNLSAKHLSQTIHATLQENLQGKSVDGTDGSCGQNQSHNPGTNG